MNGRILDHSYVDEKLGAYILYVYSIVFLLLSGRVLARNTTHTAQTAPKS